MCSLLTTSFLNWIGFTNEFEALGDCDNTLASTSYLGQRPSQRVGPASQAPECLARGQV